TGKPPGRHRRHCISVERAGVSKRDDLDLVKARPILAGDDQAPRCGIVRDPVQHVLAAALGRRINVARVDPADDLAVPRIDARDTVLVPDVRPDLAVDVLELVQPHDRTSLRAHADRANDFVRRGIEECDALGAVAHDQMLAVVRQPPAFSRVAKGANALERFEVVDEADLIDPGELMQLTVEDRDALAEVELAERLYRLGLAARQRDPSDRRAAVLARALVEPTVAKRQPLRERLGGVRIDGLDLDAIELRLLGRVELWPNGERGGASKKRDENSPTDLCGSRHAESGSNRDGATLAHFPRPAGRPRRVSAVCRGADRASPSA